MRVPFLLWLSILVFATTVAGQAATTLKLSPTSGHPSTVVTVSGTSFGDSEAVDVYVDTVDTLLLVASSTGSISGSVTIPASAAPGTHYLTAIGRHTGDAAQSAFDVGSPWSQLGFSAAHVSANPWENTLSPSNVASIGPAWINPGGSSGATGATVTVNFGTVYASTESGIEALSGSSGAVVWSYTTAGLVYASPTLSGGVVYAGSASTDTLYALNATTGAKVWSVVLGGAIYSSAAVANGIVYVGCFDDKVYAVNASTGKVVWTYATGGTVDATPTVVNGVVYVGSRDDKLYALNATTGALIWSYQTNGEIENAAAVANGAVYVSSDDDAVYAIASQAPAAGELLWKYTTGGPIYGSPAVANNTVFVGSSDGKLYALSAQAGNIEWSLTTGYVVRGPAVANGVVYFTSQGNNTFYAVAAGYGGILGSAATGSNIFGSPSISDGVVYLAAIGGGIYAFSLPANLNTNAIRRAGPPLPTSLHPDPRLRVAP